MEIILAIILIVMALRLLSDYRESNNKKRIIYVLNILHQISKNGEVLDKINHIDLNLYKILNTPKVYKETIGDLLYRFRGKCRDIPKEFVAFINNLSLYIDYDFNRDAYWMRTTKFPGRSPNLQTQKDNEKKERALYQNVAKVRKNILKYIFDKKLISYDLYNNELSREAKNFGEYL